MYEESRDFLMSVSIAQAQLYFLALTRILAIMVHVPVLGGQNIPNQVRIGLGMLLAAVIIPWQPLPANAAQMGDFTFGFGIGRELLIGTLAGFAAAATFAAVQIAGEVMGLEIGFGAARVLNPAMGDSGSALDQFFVMIALLLFLALNGHHLFLIGLQKTFQALPVGGPMPDFSAEPLMRMFAALITAGVQMALPVLGAVLLADITLGLLARIAPQVQVFFLGLPVKVGIGLFAMMLSMAIAIPRLGDLYQQISPRMLQLLGAGR
jgi:flagellar biosynthesis protein FliR